MRWVIVGFAGLFAIAGVIASFEEQDSAAIMWLMRLGLPTFFFTVLCFVLRDKPDRALREKLKQVAPDRADTCVLCSGALILDYGWRCSQCGAQRMDV
jgi:hypothetical protein